MIGWLPGRAPLGLLARCALRNPCASSASGFALIPFLEKEVKKGEEITLYVEWVGAKKINGKWEWVFMMHEFEKQ